MSSAPDPVPTQELIDPAQLERAEQIVRAATYEGRDPQHLVTAVVDADGLVVRVAFGRTVGSHAPEAVDQAVLAAIDAAQQRMTGAWRDLAARLQDGAPEAEPSAFGETQPYVEDTDE